MSQFPTIRRAVVCPHCFKRKDVGNVVCWGCHREMKNAHDGGYGPFDLILHTLEQFLAAMHEAGP